jgi:hypothetical protein
VKIHPVGAEFHVDGRTEKHDELKVTSCNFVNAHKKTKRIYFILYSVYCYMIWEMGEVRGNVVHMGEKTNEQVVILRKPESLESLCIDERMILKTEDVECIHGSGHIQSACCVKMLNFLW